MFIRIGMSHLMYVSNIIQIIVPSVLMELVILASNNTHNLSITSR